jgi:hypothetical protein
MLLVFTLTSLDAVIPCLLVGDTPKAWTTTTSCFERVELPSRTTPEFEFVANRPRDILVLTHHLGGLSG